MKLLSRIYEEKNHYLILAFIVITAFMLRLAVFFFTVCQPGDGPARVTKAYVWSRSPYFQTHGTWLPGYTYLVGTFSLFFDDPLVASRLVNLMLGSLTVPLFYFLIRKISDPVTALLSAGLLAIFPLHIALSAGSLTELSFAFEVIAAALFLIMASEAEATKKRTLCLVLSLFSLCFGAMTRYEAWVLIPLFPLYYFWKTRRMWESLLMLAVLLVFPSIWTLNSALYMGDPFWGFSQARGWHHGAQPVTLIYAIRVIIGKSIYHLGWIVPLLVVTGVSMQLFRAARRTIAARQFLYILIAGIFWAGVLAYTLARGTKLWDRYLLLAFIAALPFSALPLTYYWNRYKHRSVIVIAIAITICASVIYKPQAYQSLRRSGNPFYVTLMRPTEMKNLAEWIKSSPYRESSILLTRIQGQSSYLPVYYPEGASRLFIIKHSAKDADIQRFLKSGKPTLLITFDGDDEVLSRIENLLGTEIGDDMVVHTEDYIKVYDIASAVNSK
jgi:4-amino-4-deoxy-L-arabinose transferase-like glycosyltransferase